ncbi:MAG: ABC transporter substrate-binding protein [Deltaproteobacteria bacterium]|nr:ABC transporter substrate-binding protein [Deltaproteobacteria bacterium]
MGGFKKKLGVIWLILAALSFVCMGPAPAAAEDVIKIGTINPMTGGLALAGQETFRGVKVAADMQNARGGVQGKMIELLKGDSETPKTAITEAERLITVEDIKLFCGHYSSARAKAASNIYEKYGAVSMVVTALADDITNQGLKYTFQAMGRATLWGGDAAKFVAEMAAPKLGKKPEELTVALAHEDSDFGTSISDAFIKEAEKYGMKMVAREPYSYKSLDLSSVVLRIKNADPDILILTPYIRDGVLFLQQARDAGLSPKLILCPGGVLSNQVFYEKLGDDMNYLLCSSGASLDPRKEAFQAEGWDALQEFEQRYTKEFGQDPPQDAHHGFNGAWFFFHSVLPKAKSLNPDDVEAFLRTIDVKPGESTTTYGYKFAGMNESNPGANVIGWPNIYQWQNGSIKHLVYPAKYATSELMLPTPAWSQRSTK